jgi:hypothetical protein
VTGFSHELYPSDLLSGAASTADIGNTVRYLEGAQYLFPASVWERQGERESTVVYRKLCSCFRFHLREQSNLLYPTCLLNSTDHCLLCIYMKHSLPDVVISMDVSGLDLTPTAGGPSDAWSASRSA